MNALWGGMPPTQQWGESGADGAPGCRAAGAPVGGDTSPPIVTVGETRGDNLRDSGRGFLLAPAFNGEGNGMVRAGRGGLVDPYIPCLLKKESLWVDTGVPRL